MVVWQESFTTMCASSRSGRLYISALRWWFGKRACMHIHVCFKQVGQRLLFYPFGGDLAAKQHVCTAMCDLRSAVHSSPLVVVWLESMWSTVRCALSRSGRSYALALWWWFGPRACVHSHVCFEQIGAAEVSLTDWTVAGQSAQVDGLDMAVTDAHLGETLQAKRAFMGVLKRQMECRQPPPEKKPPHDQNYRWSRVVAIAQ